MGFSGEGGLALRAKLSQIKVQSEKNKGDGWPYYWVLNASTYIFAIAAFWGAYRGGGWAFAGLGMFFVSILLDILLGENRANPSLEEIRSQDHALGYRMFLYMCLPTQYALNFYVIWRASSPETGWLEYFGLVLSLGIANSLLTINVAHELMHKNRRWEQALSKILLVLAADMVFFIDHLKVHHIYYCTPVDPLTSYKGESFWKYFARSFFGKFSESWKVEVKRLQKAGYAKWGAHNQMLWFVAVPAAFCALLSGVFGIRAGIFYLLQSFIAVMIFIAVTFIQHYGLKRKEISPGHYEKGSVLHSWDTYCRVSNWFALNLPRHADHHIHMSRRYHVLESQNLPGMPILPYGYPTMVFLAMIPPWFRRVMDPALDRVLAEQNEIILSSVHD